MIRYFIGLFCCKWAFKRCESGLNH